MTTTPPQIDERLEQVDTVSIDWPVFKKTLRRNYLSPPGRDSRSYVLRLYPPFEAEMQAEYYESEQGRHYDSEWSEKPFHVKPELIVLEGLDRGFRAVPEWPTEATVRNALTEEEIAADGGIEEAVETSREVFWQELKHQLPTSFDLGHVHGLRPYVVDLDWQGLDGTEEEGA